MTDKKKSKKKFDVSRLPEGPAKATYLKVRKIYFQLLRADDPLAMEYGRWSTELYYKALLSAPPTAG